MRLISSAQDINVSKSPLRAGGDSGCFPNITSPVDPLSEIHSPSCITVSPITTTCIIKCTRLLLYQIALHRNSLHICMWQKEKEITFSESFTRISEHPETQHFPQPRATTAAWDVIPPLAVNIPAAACMPPTSSGLVSVLTFNHIAS